MLLDHFHPPLSLELGWREFHAEWVAAIAADIREQLPDEWRIEPHVEFHASGPTGAMRSAAACAASTAVDTEPPNFPDTGWNPPEPARSVYCEWPTDQIGIRVENGSYSPSLLGAVEFASPAHRDRSARRTGFVARCHSILAQGAGLIVVDVVTHETVNLHSSLLRRLGRRRCGVSTRPLVSVFRAFRRATGAPCELQVWEHELKVGQPLPKVPLFLRAGPMLVLDLDAAYRRTCSQMRIPTDERV